MVQSSPIATIRGTWDEVLARRNEIPDGAVIELQVFGPTVDGTAEVGDFGGRSAYDVIKEIGFVEGPSDLATNPVYMESFGVNDGQKEAKL